ncbi:hypothetical protein DL93DRAFT_2173833 [Clavulina sp. PMI_390]|nr:hypothetical protein DL93DRAFT_2173833 [Clavulina sp. PMI_390]
MSVETASLGLQAIPSQSTAHPEYATTHSSALGDMSDAINLWVLTIPRTLLVKRCQRLLWLILLRIHCVPSTTHTPKGFAITIDIMSLRHIYRLPAPHLVLLKVTFYDVVTILLGLAYPIAELLARRLLPSASILPIMIRFAFFWGFSLQYALSLVRPVRPMVLQWYLHENLYRPSSPSGSLVALSDSQASPAALDEKLANPQTMAVVQPPPSLPSPIWQKAESLRLPLTQLALFIWNIVQDLARHAITTFVTLLVQTLKGIITAQVKDLVASLIGHFVVASLAVVISHTLLPPMIQKSGYTPPPEGEYKIQI